MAVSTCKTCKYFDPEYKDEGGVTLACRRYDRATNAKEPACEEYEKGGSPRS